MHWEGKGNAPLCHSTNIDHVLPACKNILLFFSPESVQEIIIVSDACKSDVKTGSDAYAFYTHHRGKMLVTSIHAINHPAERSVLLCFYASVSPVSDLIKLYDLEQGKWGRWRQCASI